MNNSINLDNVKESWYNIINSLCIKHDIFNKIKELDSKYNNEIPILPNNELIFKAFNYFELNDLNVILIGQDPYINKNQAMGLSFSIPTNTKLPPSLKNIYKCIENTCKTKMNFNNGDLTHWANQGILLLNKTLTVFEKLSNSHKKIWKNFTNDLIKFISDNTNSIIFILWGNDAKSIIPFIDQNKHHILQHTHPSPLSRKPFINCDHFVKTNLILKEKNKKIINWSNI